MPALVLAFASYTTPRDTTKRWGPEVARRRGKLRARVAVARRLALIMHRYRG